MYLTSYFVGLYRWNEGLETRYFRHVFICNFLACQEDAFEIALSILVDGYLNLQIPVYGSTML